MVREVVGRYLEREGFSVTVAADGVSALREIEAMSPDLLILDVMLPHVNGLDVLTDVRRSGNVPVVLLTARDREEDVVRGLELGADDYVVKPFSPRELAARVKTVLRRTNGVPPAIVEARELRLDPASRRAAVGGRPVELARREFDLLLFLASNPGQVFTRAQLLDQVWGSSVAWQDPATVTVHVRRVRAKLGFEPSRWIETVRGVGYRFNP
jgi:DNA-binding response OmpR family regulator